MAPLPLQSPLHVGDGEEDGVHLVALDQVAQLLEGDPAPWLGVHQRTLQLCLDRLELGFVP